MTNADSLTVALVKDVFPGPADHDRLVACVAEAAGRGASLVVLPELPLNPWSPSSRTPRDDDAEDAAPSGPRCRMLSGAAREAGVAVLGGAIVIPTYALSMFVMGLGNIVAVSATSSRLPLQDPALKATMGFLGKVFQK